MQLIYPATFEKVHETYVCQFPDIPSIKVHRASFEECYRAASKELQNTLNQMDSWPTPTDVYELQLIHDYIVVYIGVDIPETQLDNQGLLNKHRPEWMEELYEYEHY